MAKKQPRFVDLEFVGALQRLLRQFAENRKLLAAALDVHPSTLSRWMNGQTSPRTQDQVAVLNVLRRKEERAIFRMCHACHKASPAVQVAVRRLIERGPMAWDEFDAATRDSLCDLFLKVVGGETDD